MLGDKSNYQAQLQLNIAAVIRSSQATAIDSIDEKLMAHLIDGFDNDILKNQLIDGSSVAFQTCGLQPADATPDNGLDSSVVPVEPSEHFTVFTTDDDLGEAVVAAVAALFSVGAGIDHPPSHQLLLYSQEDVSGNDCLVISFHIILGTMPLFLTRVLLRKSVV